MDAAETARSKMQHQLEKLQSQAARAEAQKGELVARKAEYLSNSLYPEKGLQERGVGAIYFLARYGEGAAARHLRRDSCGLSRSSDLGAVEMAGLRGRAGLARKRERTQLLRR